MSFSTGFTSTGDDSAYADRAADLGGRWTFCDIYHGCQFNGTSPVITDTDYHDQLKEDSPRLTEVVQPTDHFLPTGYAVQTSLKYELTHFPWSMISNRDQKLNKANKEEFSKTSL